MRLCVSVCVFTNHQKPIGQVGMKIYRNFPWIGPTWLKQRPIFDLIFLILLGWGADIRMTSLHVSLTT